MRYDNGELQELLAAEYVLGNLRGGARRRFVALMHRHPGLRRSVAHWEEHLFPLVVGAPAVQPPARVWRAISARIAGTRSAADTHLVWWRKMAMAGTAFALVALLYVGFAPPREPPATMIAVLTDARAEPSILISWTAAQAAQRQVSVRILTHPDMAPSTSWEAWLLPADAAPPISLGLITNEIHQTLQVSAASARALDRAIAIGVSVEPKAGSVTGRPTEPFLLKGPALRL